MSGQVMKGQATDGVGHPPPAPPRHRDEVSAAIHLRLGRHASVHVAARATPAGLLAVGALVSSIILSVAPLVWAARRRP